MRVCQHEIAAADNKKVVALTLYKKCDTAKRWKDQYTAMRSVKPVAVNVVLEKPRGTHVHPVTIQAPRGRPKNHKRIKGE